MFGDSRLHSRKTKLDFSGSICRAIPDGRAVSVIAQTALVLTDKVQLTLLRLNF
jgi:hypothetical protein